jgi:hypothetical protein
MNAAASWAATPRGLEAFELYRGGDLEHLAKCDSPGWVVVEGVCYPQPNRGRIYGWNVSVK